MTEYSDSMYIFAIKLMEIMYKKDFFSDVTILVNNQKWASNPSNKELYTKETYGHIPGKHPPIIYYVAKEPCDAETHIEYCNPDTVTITFEGPMYHAINSGETDILDRFDKLAKAYGLYTEQGHAWSLSFYEL